MSLALATLKAVGDKANDREAVRKQLLENTKGRDSVLGTYDIDENGDTTLTDYGLYDIKDGKLDVREGDQGRAAGQARASILSSGSVTLRSGYGGGLWPVPAA